MRCLLSGARINQKTLDWPPLIARRKAFAVPYAKLLPIGVLFSVRATFWGTVEAIKMPAGRQALQNAKFVTKEILKQLATANRVGRRLRYVVEIQIEEIAEMR